MKLTTASFTYLLIQATTMLFVAEQAGALPHCDLICEPLTPQCCGFIPPPTPSPTSTPTSKRLLHCDHPCAPGETGCCVGI
ncbi:hypothetical protein BD410DRAFT_375008 [Rickenella mellea]|uniref:Uncharacterized protein n=1 Tax=Rickenella mellea TaxID=50990 RepID=A0A4Y7PZ37_9AGAM|nr:hypothetical protein BD410DRAFT_375008 [Rickenella mellea]